jgi:PST family polysaccharide transporter
MSKKVIARNAIILAGPKILTFFIGLFRSKLNALYLGTYGIGVIGQVNFASTKVSKFSLLGVNDGVTKLIAEKKNDVYASSIISTILKTYLVVVVVMTSLSTTLLFLFQDRLTRILFEDINNKDYYYIVILLLPIYISYSLPYSILKAFKASKLIAKVSYISTIIVFLLFVPAIIFFSVKGVIVIIIFKGFLELLLTNHYAYKLYLIPNNISYLTVYKSKFSLSVFKELGVFASYGFGVGVFMLWVEFTSRALIISKLGIDALGVYTPNIAWSGIFTSIVLSSMYTYLYPKYSELKCNIAICKIINDATYIVIFAMMPFLFLGIASRNYVIPLFYSKEFIEAAQYLPYHFGATFFFVLMETISQVFTPTGRIRINARFIVLRGLLQVGIAVLLVDVIGLYAYPLMLLIPSLVVLLFAYYYLHKELNFIFTRKNIVMFLYLFLSSFLILIISNVSSILATVMSIILLSLSILFIDKNTRKEMMNRFGFNINN